jgi:hypothetical protein
MGARRRIAGNSMGMSVEGDVRQFRRRTIFLRLDGTAYLVRKLMSHTKESDSPTRKTSRASLQLRLLIQPMGGHPQVPKWLSEERKI